MPSDDPLSRAPGTSTSVITPEPLSANVIFAVLEAEPEAMVEVKQLAADLATQRGTAVQPGAISDAALYAEITSSRELRANIGTYFRQRGYMTADEFERAPLPDDGEGLSDQAGTRDVRNSTAGMSSTRESSRARSPQSAQPKTQTQPHKDTQPEVLHRTAPYNLLSLRDLYTQLPVDNRPLRRFGSDAFLQRGDVAQAASRGGGAADLPAGQDYVLGPGDALEISFWGGVTQSITRSVDREGKLVLPEAGTVQVAGLTLERAQGVIANALRQQYRNVQVSVTVAHVRSINVYVVGDVQRPGAYEINALATPLNALYAAGGPTSSGSFRVMRHYRGQHLLCEIDLYAYLLHGVVTPDRLESGDTVLVPPAGKQVAVGGAVKRPAIYELRGEPNLAALLEEAGGTEPTAALQRITVERIGADHQRETISLPVPGHGDAAPQSSLAGFAVHDGDRVYVAAILPYSQRIIYTEGHVARPGRTPFHDGMHLNDVIGSYRDLLPEPSDRGEILRLTPPDLHVETIEFSVPDVMVGNVNPALQPFDTVRVLGRYEADSPKVTVSGEVLRPGIYPLSHGMTAAQLVRIAGGFKRDALLTEADLTSYQITAGSSVASNRSAVRIGDAVAGANPAADAMLKPGDVLTIHQLTGWDDIGASVTIEGEVAHPGSYGFQQGERLSSVLRRAGGLRSSSYPAGAVLIRDEVRKLEQKSREELIRQIETSSAAARMSPNVGSGDQAATLRLIEEQQNEVLSRLRSQPASGRLVIHITDDIKEWENTPADIEVRAGDVLRVPKTPAFVLVSGQVYNASAITFTPGKTAGWYLRAAGGATEIANPRQIFVIRANGSVVGRGSGSWMDHNVLSTRLNPGDVVVVPQKIIGSSLLWRNLLTVAQITSSIAITAAVAGVL